MSDRIRMRLTHALLAILLAAGLLMPLLGILDPDMQSATPILWIVAIVLCFELVSFNRISAVITAVVCLLLLAVWLFGMNGLVTLSDVFLAVVLRFNGIRSALPLVASSALAVLTVFLTLVSCFACLRGASMLPSALLCFSMILLIYLSGSAAVLPWFLPALLSFLLILMTDRFPETPVLPVLPFAAVVIIVSLLLSGNGIGSNPLREKADELRQAVLDRLFFTEPRDVFSLSTEGFYPEGQDQLGGEPAPNDHPVMMVSSPRTVYLRGVILNEYTGRSWRNTTGGRRYLWQSSRLSSTRAALFDEELPSRTVRNALCDPVTVTVRMLSDSASTLFVPQRIRGLTPGGDLVPYFSNSSEVFVTRNLKAGDSYTVSAPIFQAGDPGLGTLIEVCSTLDDSAYEQIAETYTSLPSHLEEPVYALARQAASVAVSPYERALALRSWLNRTYRYTTEVEPQPGDRDFVTTFLLDTHEGYCTYFASAMTVLCRMVGLPARYVEGYLAEPDCNGEAVVTGLSAHAWTEVYFKGFGWLTFDATPKRSSSGSGGSSQEPTPSPSPDPSPAPTPEPPEPEGSDNNQDPGTEQDIGTPTPEPSSDPSAEPSAEPDQAETPLPTDEPDDTRMTPAPDEGRTQPDTPGTKAPFPWLLLLLILLLLALILRIWFTSPGFRARRAKTENDRFDVWAQEITDLLYAENLKREKGETPMAFGRRVDRTGLFGAAMGPVGECVSLIRYSRVQASETDTGLIRGTSVLLRDDLSRPARLRYLLRRLFVPLRRRDSL